MASWLPLWKRPGNLGTLCAVAGPGSGVARVFPP